jgi:hypothetical protein
VNPESIEETRERSAQSPDAGSPYTSPPAGGYSAPSPTPEQPTTSFAPGAGAPYASGGSSPYGTPPPANPPYAGGGAGYQPTQSYGGGYDQYAGGQPSGGQYSGGQYSGGQYSGGQYSGTSQYSGSQYESGQYQPTQSYGAASSGYGQPASYGQSGSYGQPPGYGQAEPYGSGSYGTGYGQPAGYGGVTGYTQQPGYGQPQQPARKKSKKGLLVGLVALIVVLGALALVSVLAKIPSSLYPKKLSHSAVENFIQGSSKLNKPTNVSCNGGKDIDLKKNGATFTCSAAGGRTFTVTITDKNDGHYTVR